MGDFTILEDGSVTSAQQFVAGAAATGMKSGGAYDVTLIVSEVDCTAAGVFTTSQVKGAPILVDMAVLAKNGSRIRGIIANAKYSNACTGEPGIEAVQLCQKQAGAILNCEPEQLFMLSTGVIGVQMPLDKIGQGIEISALKLGKRGIDAAKAIMTTDTRPKHVAAQFEIGGKTVTIGGIAKGSGMIHPNMATMLGMITTDAAVPQPFLQRALTAANNTSFNRITVDGDTSTSDCVLLLANGASGVTIDDDAGLALFQAALNEVCKRLAHMVVRDGEGVTKFVEIYVSGAPDHAAAHQIANTIATSPLVKTAFAGSDANWGRILAAAGRAGVPFDQNKTFLWIAPLNENSYVCLLENGLPVINESEAMVDDIFAQPEFKIKLEVGDGDGQATVWTGDLTHDYVTINADYRT